MSLKVYASQEWTEEKINSAIDAIPEVDLSGYATEDYVDNLVGDSIPTPVSAAVGQIIAVKSVDENGKPTAWEVIDLPEDEAISLEEIDEICVFALAPGLYKNGAMIMTWDELLENTSLELDRSSEEEVFDYLYNANPRENIPLLDGDLVMSPIVKDMDSQVFTYCTNLTSVIISPNLTMLGVDCFAHSGLTEIKLHDNITYIADGCFTNCVNLRTVVIGAGVTTIQIAAFNNCPSLESITYNGTMAQWNAITKDEQWYLADFDVTPTPLKQIICLDGTIVL